VAFSPIPPSSPADVGTYTDPSLAPDRANGTRLPPRDRRSLSASLSRLPGQVLRRRAAEAPPDGRVRSRGVQDVREPCLARLLLDTLAFGDHQRWMDIGGRPQGTPRGQPDHIPLPPPPSPWIIDPACPPLGERVVGVALEGPRPLQPKTHATADITTTHLERRCQTGLMQNNKD
jgi:hypothetical protein